MNGSMVFRDREHAAELLADELRARGWHDVLVLGVPRGGVGTGAVVARAVQTMGAINASSTEIVNIIGVIEGIAFQNADILSAMQKDLGKPLASLNVDGGAAANNLLMQFQADLLATHVRRPIVQETTALGAAYLAGLAVGFWQDQSEIAANWALDQEFTSSQSDDARLTLRSRWNLAIERSRNWESV